MGNNCCQESKLKRHRLALLLVGLDNAGKTVTAKGLAGEPTDKPIPTIGFSVIELRYKQYDVKIFDLGGGAKIRGIWHRYFIDVHGVIFVVDSCDTDRFPEVRKVFEDILSSNKITGKPVLILANKQDQESALDEVDIIEYLKIEQLVNTYKCPALVQSCCANEMNYHKTDPGIKQGYEWIVNYIDKNYEKLNIRVQLDMVAEEIQTKQEMLEKLKRIKAEKQVLEDPDAIQTFSEYASKINGVTVKNLEVLDVYPNLEECNEVNHSTSGSTTTFPEIYYVNTCTTKRERPQSAIQIVKHQLQNNHKLGRSQSAKTQRNIIAPSKQMLSKEFMPTSAAKVILVNPQNIKSATEKVFTISGNDNGPGGDFYRPVVNQEVLSIHEAFEVKKLPSVNVGSKDEITESKENGICMVDVE
ncbi:ADP-ribosylation factor-like protein 13B [Euwallacea fornicatus]|uniref:ADP-ribosylation factor-like protein 13B n=1 Tax=Euwallacea fornicatus TaxID=995702 RepID=UPI00338D5C4E